MKITLILFFIVPVMGFGQYRLRIDGQKKFQQIDNIGASGAWFSENIGRYWPRETREQMAKWLFSKKTDREGDPEGIGLSAFRFNIGGGTAEMGDSSHIRDFRRRVEGFLKPDGSYDWSKQAGYLWFVKQARDYGVEKLIAFSNTPPVQMTQNGLGFKTARDFKSNLARGKYPEFAHFLQTVLAHFDRENLHFDYISPVNEPQWDWYNGSQEGTPWTNPEIAHIVKSLDSCLTAAGSKTRILLPEAGHLEYLYKDKGGPSSRQIQTLYGPASPLRINHLSTALNVVGGHSYYTDGDDSARIAIRKSVRDTAAKYGTHYWQTEYSMLGDGYKEGKDGKIPAMDCALFLAKVIHDDLVFGNAAAWQLWNSWEPGNANFDTRYCLIALHPKDPSFRDGEVTATKNLWAMGQYSRFVRPGMQRIEAVLDNGLTDEQQARDVMVSAFTNQQQTILIFINYTTNVKSIQTNFLQDYREAYTSYLTDKSHNLQATQHTSMDREIRLAPKSITTLVLEK